LVEHILAILRILLPDGFKKHREAAQKTNERSSHSSYRNSFIVYDLKKKRKINKNIVDEQTAYYFLFAF